MHGPDSVEPKAIPVSVSVDGQGRVSADRFLVVDLTACGASVSVPGSRGTYLDTLQNHTYIRSMAKAKPLSSLPIVGQDPLGVNSFLASSIKPPASFRSAQAATILAAWRRKINYFDAGFH